MAKTVTARKPAAPKLIIAPPADTLVYVAGERPGTELVPTTETTTTVTFVYDHRSRGIGPIRVADTTEKIVRQKVDRTVYHRKEFPSGEAMLSPTRVGAAVAEALKMHEAGLKNVRLYTMDGSFLKKFTATEAKKVAAALGQSAIFTRRENKLAA